MDIGAKTFMGINLLNSIVLKGLEQIRQMLLNKENIENRIVFTPQLS